MIKVNAERTRAVDDAPVFGIACYEIRPDDPETGHHVGVLQSPGDAERWLRTGEPKPTKVYG